MACGDVQSVPPITVGGIRITFTNLVCITPGSTRGGWGGRGGANTVVSADRANFNGKHVTGRGNYNAYRPSNFVRTITFDQDVTAVSLYVADVADGQRVTINARDSAGGTLSSWRKYTGDARAVKVSLAGLTVRSLTIVGNDPIGIDNLAFQARTGAAIIDNFTNAQSCTPCPKGTYGAGSPLALGNLSSGAALANALTGSVACLACPAGLTTAGVGTASVSACIPIKCGPGQYVSVNATSSITTCISCESGRYQPAPSSAFECLNCGAGNFTTTSRADADGVGVSRGATYCNRCPRYWFNPDGDESCELCSSGTWPSPSGASCVQPSCTAGQHLAAAAPAVCGVSRDCTPNGACAPGGRDRARGYLEEFKSYATEYSVKLSYNSYYRYRYYNYDRFIVYNNARPAQGSVPYPSSAGDTRSNIPLPNNVLFDSGCTRSTGRRDIKVPSTSSKVIVHVIPNCRQSTTYGGSTGHSGTHWSFSISCTPTPPPPVAPPGWKPPTVICVDCETGRYQPDSGSFAQCATCAAGHFTADTLADNDGTGIVTGAKYCNMCPANMYNPTGDAQCTACPQGTTPTVDGRSCRATPLMCAPGKVAVDEGVGPVNASAYGSGVYAGSPACSGNESFLSLNQPGSSCDAQCVSASGPTHSLTFHSSAKTWADAQADCVSRGGHLATICDKATFDAARALIGRQRVWIGGRTTVASPSRTAASFTWARHNGKAGCCFKFWKPREPSGDGLPACVEMWGTYSGQWNDKACTYRQPYLCDAPLPPSSPPFPTPAALSPGMGKCKQIIGYTSFEEPNITGATSNPTYRSKGICSLALDGSGGDAGYGENFDIEGGGYTLQMTFTSYSQRDRLIVWSGLDDYPGKACSGPANRCPSPHVPNSASLRISASQARSRCAANANCLYDSGCVGVSNMRAPDIVLPTGTSKVRVIVLPNCQRPTARGTAWVIKMQCVKPKSSGSGTTTEQTLTNYPLSNPVAYTACGAGGVAELGFRTIAAADASVRGRVLGVIGDTTTAMRGDGNQGGVAPHGSQYFAFENSGGFVRVEMDPVALNFAYASVSMSGWVHVESTSWESGDRVRMWATEGVTKKEVAVLDAQDFDTTYPTIREDRWQEHTAALPGFNHSVVMAFGFVSDTADEEAWFDYVRIEGVGVGRLKERCVSCAPGKYWVSASTRCALCPLGTFQTASGRTTCERCPSGRYTRDVGATSAAQCGSCTAADLNGDGVTTLVEFNDVAAYDECFPGCDAGEHMIITVCAGANATDSRLIARSGGGPAPVGQAPTLAVELDARTITHTIENSARGRQQFPLSVWAPGGSTAKLTYGTSSNFEFLTEHLGWLYFVASAPEAIGGTSRTGVLRGLYKSDGTQAGTILLKQGGRARDTSLPEADGNPNLDFADLIASDEHLFFVYPKPPPAQPCPGEALGLTGPRPRQAAGAYRLGKRHIVSVRIHPYRRFSASRGLLEMQVDSQQWAAVRSTGFTAHSARVVCEAMGFKGGGRDDYTFFSNEAQHKSGDRNSYRYTGNNLICSSSATQLADCTMDIYTPLRFDTSGRFQPESTYSNERVVGIDCDATTADAGGSICDLSLNSRGGDAGYGKSFSVGAGGYTLQMTFTSYSMRDRLIVWSGLDDYPGKACSGPANRCPSPHVPNWASLRISASQARSRCAANANCLYDSGCVGVSNMRAPAFVVPASSGRKSIRVIVLPNCQRPTARGTAWIVSAKCSSLPQAPSTLTIPKPTPVTYPGTCMDSWQPEPTGFAVVVDPPYRGENTASTRSTQQCKATGDRFGSNSNAAPHKMPFVCCSNTNLPGYRAGCTEFSAAGRMGLAVFARVTFSAATLMQYSLSTVRRSGSEYCAPQATFQQATQICKADGARLCTAMEAEAGCTYHLASSCQGTGSRSDRTTVWTSTPCDCEFSSSPRPSAQLEAGGGYSHPCPAPRGWTRPTSQTKDWCPSHGMCPPSRSLATLATMTAVAAPPSPPAPPIGCNFDSGSTFASSFSSGTSCSGWAFTRGYWRVSPRAPSYGTGPSRPHAGRYFAFMEANRGRCGDYSHITSPRFSQPMTSLTFYYHMYGREMGQLSVEQLAGSWNVAWTKSSQQHSSSTAPWLRADVALSSGATQLRFVGRRRGCGNRGYMAVDSVVIAAVGDKPRYAALGSGQRAGQSYLSAASLQPAGSSGRRMQATGDTNSVNRGSLWVTDGTVTRKILENLGGTSGYKIPSFVVVSHPPPMGSVLYFDHGCGQLWRSDGKDASTLNKTHGTYMLKTPCANLSAQAARTDGLFEANAAYPCDRSLASHTLSALTAAGDALFFYADDCSGHGKELWTSDGTRAGTRMVKDIYPGSTGSDISSHTAPTKSPGPEDTATTMVAVGSSVFFLAEDGTSMHGALWKSDGTAQGTVKVKDINAFGNDLTWKRDFYGWTADGGGAIALIRLDTAVVVGQSLYFMANDGNEFELWVSNGTSAGTSMVRNLWAGPGEGGNTLCSTSAQPSTKECLMWGQPVAAVGTLLYLVMDDSVGASNTPSKGPIYWDRYKYGSELWIFDTTQ
eukprot:COSAG01_NODE_2289_length_7984_cov_52.534432_2_plen_2541_part_01